MADTVRSRNACKCFESARPFYTQSPLFLYRALIRGTLVWHSPPRRGDICLRARNSHTLVQCGQAFGPVQDLLRPLGGSVRQSHQQTVAEPRGSVQRRAEGVRCSKFHEFSGFEERESRGAS